jgi:hypothetical protein
MSVVNYAVVLSRKYNEHTPVNVYMAGSVVEPATVTVVDGNKEEEQKVGRICQWREIAFNSKHGDQELGTYDRSETLCYAGPTINSTGHGFTDNNLHAMDNVYKYQLVARCSEQVRDCDVVFAWIDRKETVGTVVEVTIASMHGKPVFIAFATEELADHFYFVVHLSVQHFKFVGKLEHAWDTFREWLDGQKRLEEMKQHRLLVKGSHA